MRKLSKIVFFTGGPFSGRAHICHGLKTNKIIIKDWSGYYVRNSLYENSMHWRETQKYWYLVEWTTRSQQEHIDTIKKLGCHGSIEYSTMFYRSKNKTVIKIGIDIDSYFTAFELKYSELIQLKCDKTFSSLSEFKTHLYYTGIR
jgi:hypothetical protein